jgi:hypothetical protein
LESFILFIVDRIIGAQHPQITLISQIRKSGRTRNAEIHTWSCATAHAYWLSCLRNLRILLSFGNGVRLENRVVMVLGTDTKLTPITHHSSLITCLTAAIRLPELCTVGPEKAVRCASFALDLVQH